MTDQCQTYSRSQCSEDHINDRSLMMPMHGDNSLTPVEIICSFSAALRGR